MATTTNNGWTTPDDTDLVKDGALAIRDLGQEIDTSVGEGLLAWQTWAPTLSGGWANGNGIWDTKYVQIGKTVHFSARFTIGSTTTKGSNLVFSLPVESKDSYNFPFHAACSPNALLIALRDSVTTGTVLAVNAAGTYAIRATVTSTVPVTWATGQFIFINGTYEAA